MAAYTSAVRFYGEHHWAAPPPHYKHTMLDVLPEDVLELVAGCLPLADLQRFRSCCRSLHSLYRPELMALSSCVEQGHLRTHRLVRLNNDRLLELAHSAFSDLERRDLCILCILTGRTSKVLGWAGRGLLGGNSGACEGAATLGDSALLSWLLRRGALCTEHVLFTAARDGHTHLFAPIVAQIGWRPELSLTRELREWALAQKPPLPVN